MLQRLGVVRKFRVNDQSEIGQVDAARSHISRHANARSSISQRLHGLVAFMLAQFSRQKHAEKPRSSKVACKCRTASRVLQNTIAVCASTNRSN